MPETPTFVVNDRRKFTAEGQLRHEGAPSDASGDTATVMAAEPERKGPQLVHSTESAGGAPVSTDGRSTEMAASSSGSSAFAANEFADLPESSAFEGKAFLAPEPGAGRDPELAAEFALDELATDELATDELATDGLTIDDSGDALPAGPSAEESAEAARAYDATAERLELALRAADPGGERMPPMTFERLTQSLYTQALILLGGGAQPGETPRVDILGARQTIDMLAILGERTKGNLSDSEDRLLQSALFDLRMGFLEITQALARQAAQRQPGGPGLPGGFGAPTGPRIVR